jgi:hypothetical protein
MNRQGVSDVFRVNECGNQELEKTNIPDSGLINKELLASFT